MSNTMERTKMRPVKLTNVGRPPETPFNIFVFTHQSTGVDEYGTLFLRVHQSPFYLCLN